LPFDQYCDSISTIHLISTVTKSPFSRVESSRQRQLLPIEKIPSEAVFIVLLWVFFPTHLYYAHGTLSPLTSALCSARGDGEQSSPPTDLLPSLSLPYRRQNLMLLLLLPSFPLPHPAAGAATGGGFGIIAGSDAPDGVTSAGADGSHWHPAAAAAVRSRWWLSSRW
jgi:hypothetical protein